MNKIYFLAIMVLICASSFAQMSRQSAEGFKTLQYAGKYTYGNNNDDFDAMGEVLVYPESDTTILFYIQLVVGEPSYNMGDLYGRVILINGKGVFERKSQYSEEGCKWSMEFTDNKLIIKILDEQYECGFGYGVYADGEYTRKSNAVPEYFIDFIDDKHYFKNLKIEE